MLTLANFNTTQAKTYYKRENYYSQEEAQANSEWRGQGASKYQLSGSIDDLDAYENIVNGHSPDGKTQLRQKQNHKDKKERAGVDLTFSAPKSVSLACLVGGDNRLEEAHRIAVRRTIDLIEERYAFTRINDERVKTGNLIVAMWHHDTSRELDPHLHSHCLLMNCTQSPDGKWRTLSNEEFFRNKILLGQIYRNELALECRKLGYEIEPHPKELFEIKGYTREQIEAFSKRHEQIKEKLAEIGVAETTENKIWAWRKTRVKKNHEIDRQEMLPYWHEEADLYGVTHPIANPKPQATPPALVKIEADLVAAVQAGIEHCSERKVAFKSEEIEKFVTAKTRPFSISELRSALVSHPELIKTFDGRYTTQAALAREIATIKLMQQGKGTRNPITHTLAVEHYLENKTLTQGQREAVMVAATTTDQFIAWQGVAGAGKTYALSELKQIATALKDVAPDYEIKGFAPSAEAAKVLSEELGVEANTVARLLVSKQSEESQPNQIWIVDEAGLLSAKAAYELLERATEENARVILVGDTRQLSAIEAGNPFKSLQQAGIQTAHLDESLRQKAPDLQKAVNLAAAGQMTEALAHLEQVNRIEEIPGIEERTNKIAAEYIKLLPEERQNTLIVAGTHREQQAIVKEIRAALKQEGTLGYGVEVAILKALDITKVQARYAHHYSVGDVVVPLREYRRSGLHKSQPYTVEAITGDKLILSNVAGNHLTIDPMKFRKTVYKTEASEIAVGDRLRWTRNDKELGRRNGQEFTVTEISGQTATIEFLDGKTSSIDISQPLHCDYALVSTTYSSQGKTAERVLISSTVDLTVSQESFYVAISRAKHDLRIFAEDRQWMFEQAQHSNAQETALALLPAYQRVESQKQPQATFAQPQLVLVQNPSKTKEQKSDFDLQQSKPEPRADSRVSGGERYNPAHREERTARSQSNQEFERVESQSLELLTAINGYLELQEVEQLGADIAEINRSLIDSWLPDQGTEELARAVENLERLHEWVQRNVAQENPLELIGDHHDDKQRRSFIRSDRISDTERGRFKSSKRRGLRGKQGLAGVYAKTIEYHPVDSKGDVKRLHRPVQASLRGTEIGQNERFAQLFERGNEQSFNEAREYEHGTASGQRAGDVSLRRNYGQEEAKSAQGTEAITHVIEEWSADKQWTIACSDLAQLVQSVNDEQIIEESGLSPKLAALTQHIAELNLEPRQYQFEGLSELARALTQQESENNLGEGLTQIQATLAQLTQVVATTGKMQQLEAIHWAMDAAALIDELRPETEQLVQAIHNWQSEQEVSVAIAKVSEVVQLEQGQKFDFGDLAELLNSVNKEQLLTEIGLDVKLADITQQLSEFTVEVPTQFEDMSGLVENLQSVQAESQLLERGPLDQLAALTDLLAHLSSEPHEYEFEGITEIAQMFSQKQTQISLFDTLEEIAELTLHLERREALMKLAQTVHSLNTHWQFQSSGLPEQLQAISEQTTGLNNQVINYKFRGMNELAGTIYERHAAEAISKHLQSLHSGIERVDKLVRNHPQLQQLAETVRSLRSNMASLQPQIPQERQQMEVQPSPTIQAQTDGPNVAQKPLTNQKAQALEQQRLVYRQKYQELQKRVRSYPGFSNSPNWEVDIGVALLVGKESSDPDEVGRVLTQSDQLREWKALLPEDEYMVKGKAYIHQVYEQAQRLREVRSKQQQQKGDLDLEL